MIVRAMRGPYALWRALAELNVLASLRLRKVISTLVSVYVTYQVTFYYQCGVENKRNSTRNWVDRMDKTRRHGSGSGAVALFRADRSGGDRTRLRLALGGRDARAPGGAPPITLALKGGAGRVSRPQLVPMRQSCPAWWPFVVLRVPSWMALFCCFRQTSAIQK